MTVHDYLTLPSHERDSALRSMSRDDLESLARVALALARVERPHDDDADDQRLINIHSRRGCCCD